MTIIDCNESYSAQILSIFNEAIINSTALYDYKPRTMEMMSTWFENKRKGNYPVIGAISESGELMGFASFGPFRTFPAYKYTVEHSVYIHGKFRRRGLGEILLKAIIERARLQQIHVLVGGIDSSNRASIALHEKLGFVCSATMPQVGFKFGRWLDLCFYQLILETPDQPVDG